MSVNIENTIREYNMLRPGERVVVGLSGGADSVVLTRALVSLGYDVRAVHVNHMIRGEQADSDERFVRDFCAALGIKLTAERIDIPAIAAREGIGLEVCGRIERYKCFEREAGADKIATAHTLSDNAETVLMNLSRGSSLAGMRGIPPVRGNIIRPLINMTRADIERYCAENGLCYVTDQTNSDIAYTRNRVRARVIPEFEAINPSFAQAVGRLSRSASVDEEYLSSLAADADAKCGDDVRKLSELPEAVLRRVLIARCARFAGSEPDYPHLLALVRAVRSGGGCVQLAGGIDARVSNGTLLFGKNAKSETESWCVPLDFDGVALPDGRKMTFRVLDKENINNILTKSALDYDKILSMIFSPDGSVVRTRRDGDTFKPVGRPTKKLKKLLSEAKIPLDKRGALALIECNGEIIWLEHFGAAENFKATAKTQKYLLIILT